MFCENSYTVYDVNGAIVADNVSRKEAWDMMENNPADITTISGYFVSNDRWCSEVAYADGSRTVNVAGFG